jgi:SulP family sulfate permease
LRIVFPTAVAVAIISLLETILARRVACAATGACPPDPDDAQADRAAVAVGLGNFASAMFGGFGGCGLIPNTLLNSRNGGLSYVSSLAYALSLALCVILFAPVIGRIPMAALSG